MKTRPSVLILIATDAIGGPGKGLFQFLKHAPREAFDYVLCNFEVNRPAGQFVQEARRRNLPVTLIKQHATIDPAVVFRARRIVREHGINVIQTHGYKSNVIGFALHMLWGTPWVGFAHGHTDDNRKVRVYNHIDLTVLRSADRVVAVSDATRRRLIDRGISRDRVRLVYNAVEPSSARATDCEELKRRHGIETQHPVVGVVGRLNPEKGQMVFLDAMRSVVARHPTVKALVIGDGQDRAVLERYSHENGLASHVIFAGYQADLAPYYQALDLLVLPSLSEGLPNAVLEAMTAGVPVLATRVGGVPEILDGTNTGIIVPPGDPGALAHEMIALLGDRARLRILGAQGRSSLYPRFSPDERVRRILAVYDELLATRPAAIEHERHA